LSLPAFKDWQMKALLLLFVVFAALSASAQLTYQNLEVQYDSAIEYRNLKIIPITKKSAGGSPNSSFLTLGKAMKHRNCKQ
jgi:hypothetical protein